MTVWVVCGCLYNEILTPSAKSRNDSFIIAMTVWGVLSLRAKRSNPQPLVANIKTENKKKLLSANKQNKRML